MDRDIVERVAELAALRLTEAERTAFAGEFRRIVEYMERVAAVPAEGVTPLESPAGGPAPLRADEEARYPDPAALLALAAERRGGFYRVPRVLDRPPDGPEGRVDASP